MIIVELETREYQYYEAFFKSWIDLCLFLGFVFMLDLIQFRNVIIFAQYWH